MLEQGLERYVICQGLYLDFWQVGHELWGKKPVLDDVPLQQDVEVALLGRLAASIADLPAAVRTVGVDGHNMVLAFRSARLKNIQDLLNSPLVSPGNHGNLLVG